MDITYIFIRGEQREVNPIHQWVAFGAEMHRMFSSAGLELVVGHWSTSMMSFYNQICYHYGGIDMANLTIKDLPGTVYARLKEAAQAERRSLNGYVIELLKASTDERNRRKLMREGRAEFRAFLSTLPRMADSTPLIREDRERGH